MDWIDYRLPEHNFMYPSLISYGRIRRRWNPLLRGMRNRRIGMAEQVAARWAATGLLDGITINTRRRNIAELMDGQSTHLLNEQTIDLPIETTLLSEQITTEINREVINDIRFPRMRGAHVRTIGDDLVPVQPMTPFETFWPPWWDFPKIYDQDDYKFNIDWVSPEPPEFSFVD